MRSKFAKAEANLYNEVGCCQVGIAVNSRVLVHPIGSSGLGCNPRFGWWLRLAVWIFGASLVSPSAWLSAGDCPTGVKIKASDSNPFDTFGSSVDVSGDLVLVGAFWDDEAGLDFGAGYVFGFDGTLGVQLQKLMSSKGTPSAQFGSDVAIDAGTILIGGGQGVEVFSSSASSWVFSQELISADGELDDGGSSISVSGDIAVIGASAANSDAGSGSGAAYVFRFDTLTGQWGEEVKLAASDPGPGANFGSAVAISGWSHSCGGAGRFK